MSHAVMQLITAFIGSLGFAILFRVRREFLLVASLGGLFSWGIYLGAIAAGQSIFMSCLLASAFSAFYAELLARLRKAPGVLFFIPSVIPLVPGGSLYYTMIAAMERNWAEFSARGLDTIAFAAAISGGILAVISVRSLFLSIKPKRK